MNNPLLDKDFLVKLDNALVKEKWAKIIALDIDENPVQEVTGRVTDGSINIDGASAVRRSCSVSMIAKDIDINSFYWGLHTKFNLFIGLTNEIDSRYPKIIWFPQGVYLITSFSTSQGINNFNISIQGKDKMCLLNGEISGSLNAPIDFGKIEETDKEGNITISDIPIKEIIKESVHEYAKEPWHNIVINDLDDYGIELMEYKGSTPLYLLINEDTNEVINLVLNGKQKIYDKNSKIGVSIEDIPENKYNKLNEFYPGMINEYFTGYLVSSPGINDYLYSVAKLEYGQTAGYRLTDITYAGDLVANIGDSLTSILDKIVQMLGQFEYFYDVNGRFIFQKKKTYIQTTWNNLITSEDGIIIADSSADEFVYNFKENKLITSISNNPNLANVKNDFSIWGTRKTTAGAELPIHLRYAIDKKPVYYKSYDGIIYTQENYDWREIIYQMAKDYRKHNHDDDFLIKIRDNNIFEGNFLYPTGYTGYEPYYIDLEGFWRQLYNPNYLEDDKSLGGDGPVETEIKPNENGSFDGVLFNNIYTYPLRISSDNINLTEEDKVVENAYRVKKDTDGKWIIQSFIEYVKINENENYYIETNNDKQAISFENAKKTNKTLLYIKENDSFIKLIDSRFKIYKNEPWVYYQSKIKSFLDSLMIGGIYIKNKDSVWPSYFNPVYKEDDTTVEYYKQTPIKYYYTTYNYYDENSEEKKYWNKNVWNAPELLNFWFDIMETEGEISKYSIPSIGRRSKVINDSSIKSIYFRETPTVIFINKNNIQGWELVERKPGYTYIQLPDTMLTLFSLSGQGKSAQNKLEESLENDVYSFEQISLNVVPIYYLQPNTKIYIRDNDSKIDGEYSISSFSIPLNYSGTMSMSATKIPNRIY